MGLNFLQLPLKDHLSFAWNHVKAAIIGLSSILVGDCGQAVEERTWSSEVLKNAHFSAIKAIPKPHPLSSTSPNQLYSKCVNFAFNFVCA